MIFVRWIETDENTGVRRERKGWVENIATGVHGNLVAAVVMDDSVIRQVDVAQFTFLRDTRSRKRRRFLERWVRDGLTGADTDPA